MGQSFPRRSYIRSEQIVELAIQKVTKNLGDGLSITDLLSSGLARSKKQAQRMLKYLSHERKVLFTLENRKPQRYFPTCLKADIIQNMRKSQKNVPIHPTGVRHSKATLSSTLEQQKAKSFLDVLSALGNVPLFIHKLHLLLSVDPITYAEIQGAVVERNKAKRHEEVVGKAHVQYHISPNGTIMIYVACSHNPFKLESDADESILFSFLGQVRDRLLYLLSDPHERLVPAILEWRLIQCDLNKDIELTDMHQLTGINIQLKHADRVFRLYIKSLGDRAVYRAEESLKLKSSPLVDGLRSIRYNNGDCKMDREMEQR